MSESAFSEEHLISIADIDELCNESVEYVVEDFIPEKSLNIAVGDSGLGKSPLFYQMAMAVATGTPWLGHKTKKGKVLFLDYENGLMDIKELRDRLCLHMGVEPPRDFYIYIGHGVIPREIIGDLKPSLVIIDPLRGFNSKAEVDNPSASSALNDLKEMAKEFNTSFQIVHHIRKSSPDHETPALKDAITLQWLQEAAGPRALINHTDIRMGIDRVHGKPDDAALILKKYRRMQGEGSPIYLKRIFNADGDPIGYEKMSGVGLLLSPEQQEKYLLLPPTFTFTEAKRLIGNSDSVVTRLLKACAASGLVEKRGPLYTKLTV